jgi:hypothetical protein
MTEGNLRTLRPWRMYLPTPSWFRNRSLLVQLDAYVIKLLKERWTAHQRGERSKSDLLQRRIEGIIVSPTPTPIIHSLCHCISAKRQGSGNSLHMERGSVHMWCRGAYRMWLMQERGWGFELGGVGRDIKIP